MDRGCIKGRQYILLAKPSVFVLIGASSRQKAKENAGEVMAKKPKAPKLMIEGDGKDIFIRLDGKLIAKRGQPGTPHAKQWIPLEPGVVVRDLNFPEQIEIEINGVRVHWVLRSATVGT